jgi:hypothetical protein
MEHGNVSKAFRKGREKENNGVFEPNQGTLYVHIEMSL